MIKETFIQIYEQNLNKVIEEIGKYESVEDLWKLGDGISNSGGNLALHLIGNIKHFFGANLGGTGYIRARDIEFSGKNISQEEIIEGLKEAIVVLKDSLSDLSDEDFQGDYPEPFGEKTESTYTIVLYMLTHLNYHLGQINYHRRLLAS